MKCAVCGGELSRATTDPPFKISDTSIVIFKGLPVIQCANYPEYLMEDEVLRRVDQILAKVEEEKLFDRAAVPWYERR